MQASDAPLNPSPEACKYCPGLLVCPAVRDSALKPVASVDLNKLPLGERAALLLDQVAIVENLIDQVKGFYKELLANDPAAEIPGYAVVPGAARREVTDWDAARERLGAYLDTKSLNGAASYRLGELEKALGKALKLKAEPAKEKMNAILGNLIKMKEGAPILKRMKSLREKSR
jgi:hypothetical protein